MKSFLKYVLATVVGITVVSVIFLLVTVSTIVGVAGMKTAQSSVEKNSVLVINLTGSIVERTEEDIFSTILSGSIAETQSLADILRAIDYAKTDDNIKGIYIEAGTLIGTSPATLQEIRTALLDFKQSKKFIISYGDTYTQGAYYLCSVSDSVIVNPYGIIDWHGISMQTTYYKDLLDKLGIKMQVFKVGKFKSAVEPFMLNEMSEANRKQVEFISEHLWNSITTDVSKSRKIDKEKLNSLADSFMAFSAPSMYKSENMVDKFAYSDEVPQIICNMMSDVDSPEDYHTIGVSDLASISSSKPKSTSGNIIALYYAYGDIVQEPSNGIPGYDSEHEIVASKVIRDLRELQEDKNVKAVVIRVNSRGGSAYASEQIWHAIQELKKQKPVVVSMGDYAASGGYYISCAADWIVAEPTTLTGSIGIYGMFPEASELMNKKLGVHVSTVKTNAHSDLGQSLSRPFTDEEAQIIQEYVDSGYDLFVERCSYSRGLPIPVVLLQAEGKIWTGESVCSLLVDQLGTTRDAINVAAKRAEVGDDYTLQEYPSQSTLIEDLLSDAKRNSYADAQLQAAFGEYYEMFRHVRNINNRSGIQASLPYSITFNF